MDVVLLYLNGLIVVYNLVRLFIVVWFDLVFDCCVFVRFEVFACCGLI